MEYLANTDQGFADAKANLLRAEIFCKRVRARLYLGQEGSVDARKAASECHGEVIEADEAYVEATLQLESLKARRSRAEIVIDVWRSLNASQRKS